jgi:tetratricopeptide (TPR) repeat protein
MRARIGRVLGIAAAGFIWLAGCDTTSTNNINFKNMFNWAELSLPSAPATPAADGEPTTPAADGEPTGSIFNPPATPQLLGRDPNDDLSIGKKYFKQGSYGLAEQRFRRAVELHPKDAEAWLALAASYDRLKRFDLADRAYANAIKLVGTSPIILNNQGFSYMLRGDYGRARTTLLAARAKDPESPYIQNNLHLLDQMTRKKKMVN